MRTNLTLLYFYLLWFSIIEQINDMKIIGRAKLDAVKGKNKDVDKWINIWLTELKQNKWFNSLEVKQYYLRSKSTDAHNTFHFPIPKCSHVIQVRFCFDNSVALISAVLIGEKQ